MSEEERVDYIYIAGFFLVGAYILYRGFREFKILIIPGIYFLFLGGWRLADKLIAGAELMQGVYAWIIRGITLCVLVATGILYYMKYMRGKN